MRIHMAMCNYQDAGIIDDPVKGKSLLENERKLAEPFRQLPSYLDWFHYHSFAPLAFIGENVDYARFDAFINYRGDVTLMPKYSNILPALRRQFESLVCFYIFYNMGKVATPDDLTKPEYNEDPFHFRILIMAIAGLRTVYYLMQRFAYHEASLMAAGISY